MKVLLHQLPSLGTVVGTSQSKTSLFESRLSKLTNQTMQTLPTDHAKMYLSPYELVSFQFPAIFSRNGLLLMFQKQMQSNRTHVACISENSVCVHNLNTTELIQTISVPRDVQVDRLCFLNTWELAIALNTAEIKIWNVSQCKYTKSYIIEFAKNRTRTLCSTNEYLLIQNTSHCIQVLNTTKNEFVYAIVENDETIYSVLILDSLSPQFITCHENGFIVWNLITCEKLFRINAKNNYQSCMDRFGVNKIICTTKDVQILDLKTRQDKRVPISSKFNSVIGKRAGTKVLVGCDTSTRSCVLWDIETNQVDENSVKMEHNHGFCTTKGSLIIYYYDRYIRVYNSETRTEVSTILVDNAKHIVVS